MSEPTSSLTVPLDPQTKDRLDRLAAATSRSQSLLAAEAIRDYVDRETWQIEEIKKGIEEADVGDFASDAKVRAAFAKWQGR
jgi:RHH-type rel operon transcriptional repressor/antitoxin RelB